MLTQVYLQVLRLSLLSGPLFLAIVVMRLVLRRAPKWISCALWGLLALRLVCPFSLSSPVSLQPTQEKVDQVLSDMTRSHYDRSSLGENVPWIVVLEDWAGAAGGTQAPAAGEGSVAAGPRTDAPVAAAPDQAVPQPASPPVLPSRAGLLSIVWLCGAAAMILYGAVSYLRLRRRVRTAVRWKENLWQCETVDAPFVLGIFRPRIYLPFYMDPAAAEQVIAHEQAHIRRHDQLTKVFAWLLLSVYWFDFPLLGAYALLCRDIELACDERVIRDMSREARQQYARLLLNWSTDKPAVTACPLAFGEVGLKERIRTVMQYKRPARWAAALAVVLIIAAGAGFLTIPMAEAAALPALSEPYRNTADPDAVPDPVPILTARPRAVTAEEVKALATAIFGGGAIYEDTGPSKEELAAAVETAEQALIQARADGDPWYINEATGALEDLRTQHEAAPETAEQETAGREPCDWTFRPTYEGAPAGDTSIRARAELDGMLYGIRARNYVPPINVTAADIHSLDIDLISEAPVPDASAGSEELCARVNGWLEKAGLEYYAAAAVEQDGAVRVIARPLYDGVPLLPFNSDPLSSSGLPPGYDQTLDFRFSGAVLIGVHLENPLEVVSSQTVERLMGLQAALAATGPADDLTALDWQFGYVPVSTGNGTFRLLPAWRHGAPDRDGTGEVIVSAADGSLLADARAARELPGSTPTPAPQVVELEVRWGIDGPIDYVQTGYCSFPTGSTILLYAVWYPLPVPAVPEWTVDDESVMTVQPDETGIQCLCQLTGRTGTETVLHVKVNEMQADIRVIIS